MSNHFISPDSKVIAVDFDGTIVEHAYPGIGKAMLFAFATLKALQAKGHKLILWTYRHGDLLHEAVEYCRKNGIEFYAVNRGLPDRHRADCSQLAAVSQITGRSDYRDAARRANAFVRRTVHLEGPADQRGGVKGSFPVDGHYGQWSYLNWAPKFAADSLMLELALSVRTPG